ncbi:uncharacterized protein LOC109503748 [Harpegnathos saltator]|uniref:uncharacterized protein LOC109503748 n=1 Tax=Harpegnathos saltator TaxID=610380 RepID=UPI000DBED840|nr:uncharacterized protein LOC109503748 [Harpegnathos saltator]
MRDKQILSGKCKRCIYSTKLLESNEALKRKLKQSKDRNRKLKKENNTNLYKMKLKRMFTNDQLRALLTDSIRSRHWDNETIIKALRLKFACGERGYEELRKQNIPLPSIRTLQNRLQGLKFSSGISDEIFEFLKLKIPNFENERDKECSLSMDEMSIAHKYSAF